MTECEWTNNFSRNLWSLLQEYGYNQRDFAEEMGVTEAAVSYWITGKRVPSAFSLINMSYILDVSLDDLMDFGERISY